MNLYEIAAKKRGMTLYNQDGSPYDGSRLDRPIGVDSLGNEVLMGYPGSTDDDQPAPPSHGTMTTSDGRTQNLNGPLRIEGVAGFDQPPSREQDAGVYGVPHYLDPRMPARNNADPANWFGEDLAPYRSPDMQSDDDTKDAMALTVPGKADDLNVPFLGAQNYLRAKLLGGGAFSSGGVAGDTSPAKPAKAAKPVSPADDGSDDEEGDDSATPPEATDNGKNQKPAVDTDGDTDGSGEGDDGDDDDDSGLDLDGMETAQFKQATGAQDAYYNYMKNGGGAQEVDWGPALALIDSWTGSHLLPGYQHPARPMSEDERQREMLRSRLNLFKTVADANTAEKQDTYRNAQQKLLLQQIAESNERQNDQTKARTKNQDLADLINKQATSVGGRVPLYTDAQGNLRAVPYPQSRPSRILNDALGGGGGGRAAPQARTPRAAGGGGAGRAARTPKVSTADINQAAVAAYYARTGTLPDKTNADQTAGLQGYRNRLLKIAQQDPAHFAEGAQQLIHGEANQRWVKGNQGTGAILNPNAPDQEEK